MADITLTWTANPTAELVSSYKVYQSLDGAPFAVVDEVADNSALLADLAPGAYNFRVAAVNLAGESGQSATVPGPALPSIPVDLSLTVS